MKRALRIVKPTDYGGGDATYTMEEALHDLMARIIADQPSVIMAIWEKPVISRLVSLEHSHVLKPGMVFALETFWPAKDGWSAARIEEEVVVTATGCEVITKFPAEELLVAGQRYFSAGGPVNGLRESQSHLNTAAGRGEK